MRIKRYTPIQKITHALLFSTFITQSVTGLAMMFSETAWGRQLLSLTGGFHTCLEVHKMVGLFMLALFVCHALYGLLVIFRKDVDAEDTLTPRLKDLKECVQHIGWMLGGKHPDFERWSYVEKFDYWAVFWGMVILGGTGLILYTPTLTTQYLEGWTINVALWVHRIEACLAMLDVFVIHFIVAHLRRRVFPLDRGTLAGDSVYTVVEHERPAWIDRLKKNGQLKTRVVQDVPAFSRAATYVVGFTAVAIGVYLVVYGLMNAKYLELILF